MIGKLEGAVSHRTADAVIVSAGGVGYKVFCTPDTLEALGDETSVALWTHLAVREQALDLYGFTTLDELHFFELLLGVSGIGPKSALGILAVAPLDTLTTAISEGNPSYLTKVGGIGKKTAEKIVLELQEKIGTASSDTENGTLQGDEDALEALRSMGYTLAEARDALRQVPRDIESSHERLRAALKNLGS